MVNLKLTRLFWRAFVPVLALTWLAPAPAWAEKELRWKFKTGDVVHASPAYADGVVYFGGWDSYFYAVDARTGTEKWRAAGSTESSATHSVSGCTRTLQDLITATSRWRSSR